MAQTEPQVPVIRWGILGTSAFARKRVLPGLAQASHAQVTAVASRDAARASEYAAEFGIGKSYGSYDALLADPEIDAVYIVLPNHKHSMWSVRAIEAGKHVLCEKPIGLTASEVPAIIAARDRMGVKAGEAFMVATHPQWLLVREILQYGKIGELRAIQTVFGFTLSDRRNIRNNAEYGGGTLYDIGCYPVFCSRFALGREPTRAFCTMQFDSESRVDTVTTGILDFGDVQSSFMCSIQMAPYQRMTFLGSQGRLEVEIPVNAPTDRPARLFLNEEPIETPVCDQYALEFDAFSSAILEGTDVPVSLENAYGNMKVLDALRGSAESGAWEPIRPGA